MLDLVSLGELLIDFTPVGMSEKGVPLFEQNAGGGPANLACAAAKLGVKAALMGKVGADKFGEFLTQTIRENGVDVTGLATSQSHPTALAFVHLDPNGDRSFSFRRKQSADTMISFRDLNTTLIDRAKYFFFSSFIMSAPLSRKTSFQAAKYAKKAGKTVVFDPNLRLNVWESEKQAKAVALKAIRYADIVKVSEEELFFLTGENTIGQGTERLWSEYHLRALVVTLGAEGSIIRTPLHTVRTPAFDVTTVDTTAAGDSFNAALICALCKSGKQIDELDEPSLCQCARFANAVGSLTTTKKGSISATPTLAEVQALLG